MQAYTLEEVRNVLETTAREGTTTATFQELAKKMKRTTQGLKMVVYFNNKFTQNPQAVKRYSSNLFEKLSELRGDLKESSEAPQQPTVKKSELAKAQLDEAFAQMERAMHAFINICVEERTAEIAAKAEADIQQNAEELTELRAYKKRVQDFLTH